MLENNVSGYNIIDSGDNSWYLQVVGKVAYSGTLKQVVKYAVLTYDFNLKNVEDAIKDMIEQGNNAAHFGMWREFMYSFKQDLNPVRKAN